MGLLQLAAEVQQGKKKLADVPERLRPWVSRVMKDLTVDNAAAITQPQPRSKSFNSPRVTVRARSI